MVSIKDNLFEYLITLADILTEAEIPFTATPGFIAADRGSFEKLGVAALKKAGWDGRGRVFITLEKNGDDEDIVVFEDRTVTKALDEEIARRKQEIIDAESLRGRRGRSLEKDILHVHDDGQQPAPEDTLAGDISTSADRQQPTPPPSTCPDCDSESGLTSDNEGLRCDICGWGPEPYGRTEDGV